MKVLQLNADSLQEGVNTFEINSRHVKLQSINSEVVFVGYDLFPDELKAMANTPILSFMERYFLQLDYPDVDRPRDRMMREDRFKFETGSLSTVQSLRPEDSFSYNYENKRYVATWTRDDQPYLTVSFPADHELLSGENKIETEKHIEADIRAVTVSQPQPVGESMLTPALQPGFFVQKGSTYINNRLSSDLFYQRVDDAYTLINDISHPLESAANMMLSTACLVDYNLQIKQVMYGFKKKFYDVPLRQWIAFCRSNGCELYYGIESFDNETIKASVFAVNIQENYNHILFVTIPLSAIDSGGGDIQAQLDTFVPMHNVLNLFGIHGRNKNKEPKLYE